MFIYFLNSLMLIGMWIGNGMSPPVTAQSHGVFDKITCNEIQVIDKDGKLAILLNADEHGGSVIVSGKDGQIAGMSTDENGGFVGASSFIVSNKQRETAARMGVNEYGGFVAVFNKQGENRATMGVNAYGNGAVSTWDKNGYRQ